MEREDRPYGLKTARTMDDVCEGDVRMRILVNATVDLYESLSDFSLCRQ